MCLTACRGREGRNSYLTGGLLSPHLPLLWYDQKEGCSQPTTHPLGPPLLNVIALTVLFRTLDLTWNLCEHSL